MGRSFPVRPSLVYTRGKAGFATLTEALVLGAPVIRRIAVPVALRAALVPSNRSAETMAWCCWLLALRCASMGPRSEERGNRAHQGRDQTTSVSFNGAALRGARKRPVCECGRPTNPLLQWGRAPRSAETPWPAGGSAPCAALQWGRAPRSAETSDSFTRRRTQPPLQWGRAPRSAETETQ